MPIDPPILITGATGFLGSRTLEALAAKPGKGPLIAAGRTLRAESEVKSPRVQYRLGDLTDPDYVETLFAAPCPAAIVHCAALSSPWGAEADFYRANVLAQAHLVAAAQRHGVRNFVLISTPSLYVNFRDCWQVKESDPLPARLVNAYARSKRRAEQELAASGLDWIVLRPRALIGRGDTVIMPRVLRAYHAGRLRVIGNGKNVVDLTPVSSAVQAIELALQAGPEARQRCYNLTNGEPISLWEGIAYVLRQLGLQPPTRRVPASLLMALARWMEWRARRLQANREPVLTRYGVSTLARSFTLDITQARQYLGYQPQQSVWEAIDEFADWWRGRGNSELEILC